MFSVFIHPSWKAKGYSLLIVQSFQVILDSLVLRPLLTSDSSATCHQVGYEGYFTFLPDLPG